MFRPCLREIHSIVIKGNNLFFLEPTQKLNHWDISNLTKPKLVKTGSCEFKSIYLSSTFSLSQNKASIFGVNTMNFGFKEVMKKGKAFVFGKQSKSYLSYYCEKNHLAIFAGFGSNISFVNTRTNKNYFFTKCRNELVHVILRSKHRNFYYFGFNSGEISLFDLSLKTFSGFIQSPKSILGMFLSSKIFLFVATWNKEEAYVVEDLEIQK